MSRESYIAQSKALNTYIAEFEALLNTRFRHKASVKFAEQGEPEITLSYERCNKHFILHIRTSEGQDTQFGSASIRHRSLAVLYLGDLVTALEREQNDAEGLLNGAVDEAEAAVKWLKRKFNP